MDIATAQGAAGTAEGLLVLAESQGKGRGRVGRGWYSPKAKGIYMSLLLRPDIGPAQAPVLTLLAAISVCEAVKAAAGLEAKIKWPNDILINNKKLGGILTELSAETDRVRFAVVGIGLNVNNDKGQLPEGATSLKEQKKEELSRLGVLQELLRRIEQNYFLFRKKGASPVIEKWRQFNLTLGRRVRVLYHRQHLEGQALDVDKDGGLLIRKDSGITVKVSAGDIIFCRQ
jgi:BirA family biotin operon repressor/biotin-[acetyl-CoA-carboxylase] ligase